MMTAPARRPRRRSRHGAESPTLARLAAAREQLDAEIVERRRREDEQLTEYAAATDAVTEAEARRDAALADLERQATQVREAAEQELATLEARQGAVLVALHADRTAEELATWSASRSGGYAPFCARTGNPRGPPKPVPRLRRRRPQRRHRPLNWGRRPGIRGRAATGPPGRRRLQDPTQNRTRGHRPGIVRRGDDGVAPTGGGPALPVRAERIGAAWRRALPVLQHRRSSRPPRRHRQRARRRPRRCRPVSSPRSSAVGPGSSSGSGHASA